MTSVAIVIPTIGHPRLANCLRSITRCEPSAARVVVVHSGESDPPKVDPAIEMITQPNRLGFASAVNAGLERILDDCWATALVNDDAEPAANWIGTLVSALQTDPRLGAVQGSVLRGDTDVLDGRGIELDPFGLPIQADRDQPADDEASSTRKILAVSATAALYRNEALREIRMASGDVFDSRFGSYHEDLDVGLRLSRCGWGAAWTPRAFCVHYASSSGSRLRWRHPWWVLANRWRALAGNLSLRALATSAPLLLRGEARAVRSLARANLRALPVSVGVAAAIPWIVSAASMRETPGPRLTQLPRGRL